MGGAAGHLQHLYENRELTFKDLKQVLKAAAAGRLEETTEKFDGMNLMFTWDCFENSLRVARADGDIKRGGMSEKDLSEKFKERAHVSEAFSNAFKVLKGALSTLSSADKRRIFGESKNRWYSAEVIYTQSPNVVNYDCNAVAFHKLPVKTVVKDKVIVIEAPAEVDVLIENVNKMQRAISNSSWKICGPTIVRFQKLSDGSVLRETTEMINQVMRRAGVSDSNTIGDYLRSMIEENVLDLRLSQRVSEMIVSRCMGEEFSPTLNDIKKYIDKSEYVLVRQFVENSPKLFREHVRPIERAISKLSIEILKGLQSSLVSNADVEVNRIKSSVEAKIQEVQSSGDPIASHILEEQLNKLGSIDSIKTPVEGVVFVYKGNAYKFTGNFAAVGQILGLFKYNRGQVAGK